MHTAGEQGRWGDIRRRQGLDLGREPGIHEAGERPQVQVQGGKGNDSPECSRIVPKTIDQRPPVGTADLPVADPQAPADAQEGPDIAPQAGEHIGDSVRYGIEHPRHAAHPTEKTGRVVELSENRPVIPEHVRPGAQGVEIQARRALIGIADLQAVGIVMKPTLLLQSPG